MMKTCKKCGCSKELSLFPKQKQNKDGHHSYCKACRSEYDTARYDSTKRSELYYSNLEVNREARKTYYKQTKQSYYVRKAKRRASLMCRTPSWLTEDQHNQINAFYWLAKLQQELTDTKYEVDHIVPLQGKTVCGLHVPWNLQVITMEQNRQKANKL
jgi:5-methylcytosine-specific restriction endonuclease McrA